jgi:Ca2+-binding RTX toxin-like protein
LFGDTVYGGDGNDVVSGGIGNDYVYGENGDDIVNGGHGNNNLFGGNGNDILIAGEDQDWVSGAEGNDTLIGGFGSDKFIFDTTLNSLTNVDVIVDFASGTDKIQLDHTIFGALNVGNLNLSDLLVSSNPAANSGEHIIYNSTTGGLSYDSDGAGANSAVEFAVIGTSPVATILATDFIVV